MIDVLAALVNKPEYRVWCDGREFGVDYDLRAAWATAYRYSQTWPGHKYVVRHRNGRFA